jgi:predicted DNA-binding protein with PD1-like motif
MRFAEAKFGRVFILRLQDGDHLPDVVESFATEQEILNAVCFFLGGAKEGSRVVVGPKDGHELPPEPMIASLNGVHESCGFGTIFLDEQCKPKLHMHASFGRKESTVTGCVRMGVDIWRIGEIVLLELLCPEACRAVDKETGFEFLEIKQTK